MFFLKIPPWSSRRAALQWLCGGVAVLLWMALSLRLAPVGKAFFVLCTLSFSCWLFPGAAAMVYVSSVGRFLMLVGF
jgi:hypothetical protein